MKAAPVIARLNRYLFSRDMVTMAGVGIGAISMLFPWLLFSPPPLMPIPKPIYAELYGSRTFLTLLWTDSSLRGPLLAFLAGTIIAIFTRIGGLVQGFGLIGFIVSVHSRFIPYNAIGPWYSSRTYEFMVGYFLAVVSMLVVNFAGRKFAWNSRNYGNVPATGRMTALLPHATRVMR